MCLELRKRDFAANPQPLDKPLLVVGKGRWGNVYAARLKALRIPFWQTTTDWHCYAPSGVIVATPPETHYSIARTALGRGLPVLVEKPVTLHPDEAKALVALGGIGFAGHTRLYSASWMEFRERNDASPVQCFAGGTDKDPWWDWGPHIVAMLLDLGVDPREAEITLTREKQPLRIVQGGHAFRDVPGEQPLDNLITHFVEAIARGKPDNFGLCLGARVVDYLWRRSEFRRLHVA